MIRDQLLTELWDAYPDIIIDVCEVDPVRIVVRDRPGWRDNLGVVASHVPDPDWQPEPEMDFDVPEDIPIREKDTGNVFYIRVKDKKMELYDVDDNKVKKWYEVWK
jgi:hypothetical protein